MDKQKVLKKSSAGYILSHMSKMLKWLRCILINIYRLFTVWKDAFKFGPFKQIDILNKAAHRSKLLKEFGQDLSVSFEN